MKYYKFVFHFCAINMKSSGCVCVCARALHWLVQFRCYAHDINYRKNMLFLPTFVRLAEIYVVMQSNIKYVWRELAFNIFH